MTTYEVEVTRDGRWWMVSIPSLDGLTQARRPSEIESMARSYITVTLDVPLESIDVIVTKVDGIDIRADLERIRAEREEAARLERQATQDTAALARSLRDRSLTVRDIGRILGLSHQRIQQLLHV